MEFFIAVIIAMVISFVAPFWVSVVLTIINFLTPDPIPLVDEVVMLIGLIAKAKRIAWFTEMWSHIWFRILVIIGIILFILIVISILA